MSSKSKVTEQMKVDRIIHNTLSLLAGGLLTVSLSGCLDDHSACIEDQPGYQEGNDLWISFNIRNMSERSRGAGNTRADDPENHPDEMGTDPENYIDCEEGFELLMFDDQDRLIKVFDRDELELFPIESTTVDPSTGYESNHYKLTAKINKAYFDYSTADNVEFSLLLAVNMHATNGASANDSFIPYEYVATSSRVSQLMRGFNYNSAIGNNNCWIPEIPNSESSNPKRLIPMSGKRKMSIPRDVLDGTGKFSFGDPYPLGKDIDMLRAMAKIRIVDLLASEFEENAQITAVEIQGYNTKGTYMPWIDDQTNSEWGKETTQIVEIPTTNSGIWFNAENQIPMEKRSAQYNGVDHSFFIAYLPEYALTDNTDGLKLVFHYQTDNTEDSKFVQTLRWNDVINKDIARNHIYEIAVKRPDRLKLELTLDVKDWVSNEENLDFNDHPSLADEVHWYDYSDKTGEKIIVRNDKPVKVTFTLDTPRDCRWTAYLIPIKGNGAFQFTDDNGTPLTEYPSDIINGTTQQVLYIAPTNKAGVAEEVSAELCVIITTQDGQEVEADLLNGSSGRFLLRQIPN